MGYPRGRVEHAIGQIEWQMLSATEISVRCERAVIHNIPYQANVRVEKLISGERQHPQGVWRALFGNLYMRRLLTNGEPTMRVIGPRTWRTARELFKQLAEQIAVEHDNEAVQVAAQLAQLEEAKHNAEIDIEHLEVKIDELRGTIEDLDKQIAELK